MIKLLTILLPLGLGAAISPTMLAATLLTLASKDRARLRTLVFLGGSGITLVVLGALALASGKGIRMELPKPSLISTIVDIILGGLLIYIGHRKIFRKPKDARLKVQSKTKIFAKPGLLASFGLGFVITVTDFSSLVLYLAAAKQSIDAGVSSTDKAVYFSSARDYCRCTKGYFEGSVLEITKIATSSAILLPE